MSKELLMVIDAVAAEKGVPESVILEAIEAALAGLRGAGLALAIPLRPRSRLRLAGHRP